jgi:hypothetical protein
VLWLHGVAGCGKSTLATTIATFFQDINRLGAFIFFRRDIAERSNPAVVIRTLAHQQSTFDHRIGDAVAVAVEEYPNIVQGRPHLQFQNLIAGPLTALTELHSEGPVVLVLDALDECGNADDRKFLLAVLAEGFVNLPSFLRILVTSRPEYDILNDFGVQDHILSRPLSITTNAVQKDIEVYIRHRIEEIQTKNKLLQLSRGWPGDPTVCTLADRASGLFIWASTTCKFIDGHDPKQRLGILLQTGGGFDAEASLDALYAAALRSANAGKWKEAGFGADSRWEVIDILY